MTFEIDFYDYYFLFWQLSIARVGSTVNFLLVGPLFAWLSESMGDNHALGFTLLICGLTCVMSFLCALVKMGFKFFFEQNSSPLVISLSDSWVHGQTSGKASPEGHHHRDRRSGKIYSLAESDLAEH